MKFYTKYNLPSSKSTDVGKGSMACQEFKDECDINTIVTLPNYGINPLDSPSRVPSYGDFTDEKLQDFQSAQNCIAEATQLFEALPSVVRDRFSNDPGKLIDFVNNNDNYEEAKKLGLLDSEIGMETLQKLDSSNLGSPEPQAVQGSSAVAEEVRS